MSGPMRQDRVRDRAGKPLKTAQIGHRTSCALRPALSTSPSPVPVALMGAPVPAPMPVPAVPVVTPAGWRRHRWAGRRSSGAPELSLRRQLSHLACLISLPPAFPDDRLRTGGPGSLLQPLPSRLEQQFWLETPCTLWRDPPTGSPTHALLMVLLVLHVLALVAYVGARGGHARLGLARKVEAAEKQRDSLPVLHQTLASKAIQGHRALAGSKPRARKKWAA